jgi:hypothetical protein
MVYITEMIPNIWWGYTKMNSTNDIDNIYLNKFTSYHKIGDVIKIDEHVVFWNKSTQFIFDIKKQLEQKENQYMLSFIKKVCEIIDNNYKDSKSTLIFTNKYNEIGLLIWIFFYIEYAKIPLNIIEDSLKNKIQTKIIMTDKERKFLLLNIKKL